ncbi:MAG TPA: asparaginase [Anaerolineae bacterium]|nr:asparaginase [Anaerolineae bacterium]
MSTVRLVTTGGTIAMAHDDSAGGAVPTLGSADFLRLLPAGAGPVGIEEFCNLPSAHFKLDTIWGLRTKVDELTRLEGVQGIVITHGTDTMEETAYLLDLTVDTDKPMILTGAMRTVSQVGYDGIANLLAAIRVAGSEAARGLGALVVMDDEIHAARHVTKTHTQSTGTFKSLEYGPLGRVDGDRVVVARRVLRQHIPCSGLEKDVHLLKLGVGQSERFLRQLIDGGAAGVVIEALGGGRVPPEWMPSIREAIKRGMAVVIGSRCPSGRVYDAYGYDGAYRDLQEAGAIFAEGLNGQKARIKLMVALGQTRDRAPTQALFSREFLEPPHA